MVVRNPEAKTPYLLGGGEIGGVAPEISMMLNSPHCYAKDDRKIEFCFKVHS